MAVLHQEPLSTRELATWYRHYVQANRTTRTRMLAHPRLFIQALQTPDTPATDPEGQWLAELQRLCRALQCLARTLPSLLDPPPPAATWAALRTAVTKTAQTVERLRQPLQEGAHVVRTATPDDPRTARQGDGRTPAQPHPVPAPAARCGGCWHRAPRAPRAVRRQPRPRPHPPRRCPRSTTSVGGTWCGCRNCGASARARRSPTAP